MVSALHAVIMDSDGELLNNLDWDPVYLAHLFSEDFFDMSSLWSNELVSDCEMMNINIESKENRYQPVVEDISLDDEVLCDAVTHIEAE